MKKLAFLVALLLPVAASAQITTAGRASVGVDAKLFKGFHIEVDEEVRSADKWAGLGSLRTTLGISYKPISFLKVGVGYTLINPYKIDKELDDGTPYTGFWAPRHRVYGDLTGSVRVWKLQISLKERFQLTHNADYGMNPYQSTRNAMALKSKLSVKFKGWNYVEPALSFEMRAALNDPWGVVSGTEQTTKSGKKYYKYTPTGYTNAYINRLRGNLSVDIKPSKNHTISPYVMFDYTIDYKIDTNGPSNWAEKGIRLYSDTTGRVYGRQFIFGLDYRFSF